MRTYTEKEVKTLLSKAIVATAEGIHKWMNAELIVVDKDGLRIEDVRITPKPGGIELMDYAYKELEEIGFRKKWIEQI